MKERSNFTRKEITSQKFWIFSAILDYVRSGLGGFETMISVDPKFKTPFSPSIYSDVAWLILFGHIALVIIHNYLFFQRIFRILFLTFGLSDAGDIHAIHKRAAP